MTLRRTAAVWIDEGGTLRFFAAIVMKLGVELSFATLLAAALEPIFLAVLPIQLLEQLASGFSEPTVSGLALALPLKFVLCQWDSKGAKGGGDIMSRVRDAAHLDN